jgi:hypothetical protein
MASRIPWHFRDLTTDPVEEYLWEVNPKEFGFGFTKKIGYEATAAPDGRTLLYEGRDEPQKVSFSGTVLSQDQYDKMVYWFNKRHQIEIEDDLGRTFSIYITSFQPRRQRARHYPWKHTYECEAYILDWPSS